jgi:peptidoglycan/LPS O-acetylase OafA/YrhL
MSYSIYLTHFPIAVCASCYAGWLGITEDHWVAFAVIPATTLASLPGAWLFHRLVERRFMNGPPQGPESTAANVQSAEWLPRITRVSTDRETAYSPEMSGNVAGSKPA